MESPRKPRTPHELRSQAIKLLLDGRRESLNFMLNSGHNEERLCYNWRSEWDAGEYAMKTCTRAIDALGK